MPAPSPAGLSLYWRTYLWLALVAGGSAAGFGALGWMIGRLTHGAQGADPSGLSWVALSATVGGAVAALGLALAVATRRVNRHLAALSRAAEQVHNGDLHTDLDEAERISEVRQVNTGFNRLARELARVEQDRALMLAGISHDLRTPLARLRLEAEMSVADPQALRHMAADIDQLDSLIDKFADYARTFTPPPTPVDLNALAERVVASLVKSERLTLSLRVPEGLWVMADALDLSRVLQNLLENAARYGRRAEQPAARVEVQALAEAQRVHLVVRDHGPGVPASQIDRLTIPFYRGDLARTEASGAGLGLSIVHKAVQRMGGQLHLRNAEGGGFEARVTLKRARPETRQMRPDEASD
jgi:two-component system osmolarity sensor histidine kinase EnvZ